MSWVQVAETDIHYVEAGSGPPLVFLHGLGSCAEAWHQQFEALSSRFRVIAYDSVNHGHSSCSPRGEHEPDRVEELEGFLTALGLERPILAGNSMGALTILRWATRYPAGARALVPSGMGVMLPDAELTVPEATRRAMFAPVDDSVVFLPAEGGFTNDFPEKEPLKYERYVRLRSTATRIEATRHTRQPTMVNPTREELYDRVKVIESPMQIIVGEHDWLADAARHLHRQVPHSRLAVVPGAPHNVYFQTADEYNAIIDEFLTGIEGS